MKTKLTTEQRKTIRDLVRENSQAPALAFRQPEVNILEKTLSTSGKYLVFLGIHFEKGITCWVIGCSNKANGHITMRHYNEGIKGCVAPRAQAYTFWEEFKTKMKEKADEEEPGYLDDLQKYLN